MTKERSDIRWVDPQALARLSSLELRVRVVLESFWKGLHRSPDQGFSVEFNEYRPYVPGDDPRYIDWKAYGRTDRHLIKKFEDETNLRAYLLMDISRSMEFRSGEEGLTKGDYAKVLAGTLAYLLARQGDGVGLTIFDQQVREALPARRHAAHLRRMLATLEQTGEGSGTGLGKMLEEAPLRLKKRGLVVVFSDFLVPIGDMERGLRWLRARGHEVVLLQVMDPAEREFSFEKSQYFQDAETGEDQFIRPREEAEQYRSRLRHHEEAIQEEAMKGRMRWLQATTGDPCEQVLLELFRR